MSCMKKDSYVLEMLHNSRHWCILISSCAVFQTSTLKMNGLNVKHCWVFSSVPKKKLHKRDLCTNTLEWFLDPCYLL